MRNSKKSCEISQINCADTQRVAVLPDGLMWVCTQKDDLIAAGVGEDVLDSVFCRVDGRGVTYYHVPLDLLPTKKRAELRINALADVVS